MERDRNADKAASRAPARAKIDPLGALFVGGGQQRKAAEVIMIDDEDLADASHAVPASRGHAESASAAAPQVPLSAAAQIAAPDQRPFVTVTGAMREGFVRLREELRVREAARKEQARRAQRDAAAAAGGGSSKSLSSASGDAATTAGDDLRRVVAAAALSLPDRFRVLYSEVAKRPFFFDEETGVGSFAPPPDLRYDALPGGLERDAPGLEGRGRVHDPPEHRPDAQGSTSEVPAPPIADACTGAPIDIESEASRTTRQLGISAEAEAASSHAPERSRAAASASQLKSPVMTDAAGAAISSVAAEAPSQAPAGGRELAAGASGLSSSPVIRNTSHDIGVAGELPMQPADQLTAAASVVDSATGNGAAAASPAAVHPASMAPAASPADTQRPPVAAAASGQKRRRSDAASLSKASTPPDTGTATAVRAQASRQHAGPPVSTAPTPLSPARCAAAPAPASSGAAGLATRRGPVAVAAAAALPLVGAWECERCTLTNRRSNRKCEVCGHPKAGTAARVAGGAT